MSVEHTPVLVPDTVAMLASKSDGSYLDATFGCGGHTSALLNVLDQNARVHVVDRDPEAIERATKLQESDSRISISKGTFSQLKQLAHDAGFSSFDGILFDVGISSTQLDSAERGFSFQADGPLDMRMDPTSGKSAKQWLDNAEMGEMASIFKRYGDERNARPIARAIVSARPLQTTFELVEVIRSATRRHDNRKHVATRVFQAIRIHVNDELNELKKGLRQAFDLLAVRSRIATITFHSIEHQCVRHQFAEWSKKPVPHKVPVRGKNDGPIEIIEKGKRASLSEIDRNPRARSAMLQVCQRVR